MPVVSEKSMLPRREHQTCFEFRALAAYRRYRGGGKAVEQGRPYFRVSKHLPLPSGMSVCSMDQGPKENSMFRSAFRIGRDVVELKGGQRKQTELTSVRYGHVVIRVSIFNLFSGQELSPYVQNFR
jgi:hypothetical protein